MKKAIIAGTFVLFVFLLAILLKIDTERVLITMIAYWVLLDRLEKEDRK